METALKFHKDQKLHYWLETSALDNVNITKLFRDMAKFLYLRFKDQIDAERAMSGATYRTQSGLSVNQGFQKQGQQSEPVFKFPDQPEQKKDNCC